MAHMAFHIEAGSRFDLTGKTFGRLTVIARHGTAKNRAAIWKCACVCGESLIVESRLLNSGNTKSCGCTRKEFLRDYPPTLKHGHATKHPHQSTEYKSWCGMIERCGNKKNHAYDRYGGRGIKVCARWRKSFENFLVDMGEKPHRKLSLDRINVNGDYAPGNCRWATNLEQRHNRRDSKTT